MLQTSLLGWEVHRCDCVGDTLVPEQHTILALHDLDAFGVVFSKNVSDAGLQASGTFGGGLCSRALGYQEVRFGLLGTEMNGSVPGLPET